MATRRTSLLPRRGEQRGGMIAPFESLREEMDRLFEQFTTPWRTGFGGMALGAWSPDLDLSETEDGYVVTAEVPGVETKDIRCSVVGDRLVLEGEKRDAKTEKEGEIRVSERYYGAFHREFRLPEAVEAENVKARVKNGVLEIHIPKAPGAGGKQIPIEESS